MSVVLNLEKILKDIKNYNPRIIAVTKYYGTEKMIEAYNAGLRDFAESKAVESIEKINKIDDTIKSQSIYHFIGHLQTNKVKYVVGNFEYIHSVDSLKLAKCIDSEANKSGIKQKILIQVNNALEPQKFGVAPCELENLISEIYQLKSLELVGLMNIAPLIDDEAQLHKLFKNMRELKEKFNLSVFMIEHHMDLVMKISERIYVLDFGKMIASGTPEEIQKNPRVIDAYLGVADDAEN